MVGPRFAGIKHGTSVPVRTTLDRFARTLLMGAPAPRIRALLACRQVATRSTRSCLRASARPVLESYRSCKSTCVKCDPWPSDKLDEMCCE